MCFLSYLFILVILQILLGSEISFEFISMRYSLFICKFLRTLNDVGRKIRGVKKKRSPLFGSLFLTFIKKKKKLENKI